MHKFILMTISVLLPAVAIAQDRDEQEIGRYVLTDAGLAKYTRAAEKLSAVGAASGCETEDDDGDDDASTLNDLAAKIDANPAAKGAIQSAGMTSREYVLFTMSTLQTGLAAWVMDQPGGKLPPSSSMANVAFYRAHKAAIENLRELNASDCDSDDDAESEDN